jgi:predicted ribosomally synthesized peptide with nif11-like leader
MSRDAVVALLSRVREDAALRARLTPDPESYLHEGAHLGLDFSLEELRGVANAERFYVEVERNPALSSRLSAAKDEREVVALARAQGFECAVEDLQAVLRESLQGELSDHDLGQVAGGGFSFPNVSKTPTPFGPIPIPYPTF